MQPTPVPGADIGSFGGHGDFHNGIVSVTQHHQHHQMQHRHALPQHAQQHHQHVPAVALSSSTASSSAVSPAPAPIIVPINTISSADSVHGSGSDDIPEDDTPGGASSRVGDEGSSPPDGDNSTAGAANGAKTGTRSRRGCWTCRNKKAKKRCDEEKPACGRCRRMNLVCDYTPRPSLAERRRQQALLIAQQQGAHESVGHAHHHNSDLQLSQAHHHHHHHYYAQQHQYAQVPPHQQHNHYHHHGSSYPPSTASHSPLSVVRLSSGEQAPCSLQLGPLEHESIHFFRTVFAKSHHTKNPDFSLFSIMFTIAQEDKMVMHMILSLGMRAMDLRRPTSVMAPEHRRTPLFHYSAALRSMAETVCRDDQAPNMDALLTALWLMCIYEQQFGDPQCQGYSNHLMGAASLMQHQHRSLRTLQPAIDAETEDKPTALVKQSAGSNRLSLYSARILVWLALHDAAAATSGVGGHLNSTLYSILGDNDMEEDESYYTQPASSHIKQQQQPTDRLRHSPLPSRNHTDTFKDLYRYSNPLYRAIWGDQYPQNELLDDVENRTVFGFLAHANQLRFLVAQLYDTFRALGSESPDAQRRAAELDVEIRRVGKDHAELLEVASGLAGSTDNKSRLVKNIRTIVPLYYAAVLDFVGVVELFSTTSSITTTTASGMPTQGSYGTTITGYPTVAANGVGIGPGGIPTESVDSSTAGSSPTPSSPAASIDGKTKTPSMIATQQAKQQLLRAKRHAALRARAIREILTLGYQTYTHGGDELSLKIAWPLFMAALELDGAAGSNDLAHRVWIMERFAAFEAYGDNFARARRFLDRFLRRRDEMGRKGMDFRKSMRDDGEVFILGV